MEEHLIVTLIHNAADKPLVYIHVYLTCVEGG